MESTILICTPKQQAKLGKYTIENDTTCAVNHYTMVWGTHAYINKSIYSKEAKIRVSEKA